MKLLELAELSGVVFIRCDKQWGGTWGYKQSESSNMSVCGFRTKNLAAEGWLWDLLHNPPTYEAIKQLLETETRTS